MGAGQLSLRRKRGGCDREIEIRSLLHPSLFVEARCDDHVEDGAHNALRQGQVRGKDIRSQSSDVGQMSEDRSKRFESAKDLTVYKLGHELAMKIFEITKRFPSEEKYALTSQIRRSSRSICLNLREAGSAP